MANAALLPANGTNGEIAVYPSDTTHLVIDIDGYFALATPLEGLAFYPVTPCRAIDTRLTIGAFSGQQTFNIEGSQCAPPSNAAGYVMNASALPQGVLGYLTLWPSGNRPLASTLNALDGANASNMAIVGTTNGSIDAYAAGTTNLLLDLSGYMAQLAPLSVTTTSLPRCDHRPAVFGPTGCQRRRTALHLDHHQRIAASRPDDNQRRFDQRHPDYAPAPSPSA